MLRVTNLEYFQLLSLFFSKIEKKFDTCFLFESLGEESYISRYHILGFDPKYIIYPTYENLIIENKNDELEISVESSVDDLNETQLNENKNF